MPLGDTARSFSSRFPPATRPGVLTLGASVLLTFATWVVLARRTPMAEYVRGWFWQPTEVPRPDWWWAFPLLTVSVGAVLFVRESRLPAWVNLVVLILVGCGIQHLFALIEGRGLDAMRDRMLYSGHAVFAQTAVEQDSLLLVARRYDELVEAGAIPRYPHVTKPPGQLLFYMVTHRVARALPWIEGDELRRTATLASWVWPLLSYVCLVPLYLLSRLCLAGRRAYVPLLLYVSVPSVTLVVLHLDQCLYPLLFAAPLSLLAYGLHHGRWWLSFLSGASTAVALYVSYSLIALLPLLAFVLLVDVARRPWTRPAAPVGRKPRLLRAALSGGSCAAGIAVVEILLARVLHYDAIGSFRLAMSAHQSWKVAEWTWPLALRVGAVNLLEFFFWSGWAVSLLAVAYSARSCLRPRSRAGMSPVLGWAFVWLVLSLGFLGRTVGETGRLWLFLTPLVVLLAGEELTLQFRGRPWLGTAAVVVLQLLGAFAIKMWQDFY